MCIATEELRRLLDERGVEWTHADGTVSFNDGEHWFHAWAYSDDTMCVSMGYLTPKQAVEATLGRRTCAYEPDYTGFTWWDENDVEHYEEDSASDECWSASCNKCGFTMIVGDDGWFRGWDDIKVWDDEAGTEHHGILLEPIFKFCPNCGAKVVE